ncbi:Mediator of RNA polymerase II transcription subunit 13 [Candida viswanathii]|uniref:Mediator of RNA polymerase II transcription subunit 13 n=1 Tax=Candida viswanathii TaxID=5486 RepID=A0A367XRK8_9ASCO|nr:Mediator of RNA polymerase II transcription subunit 13 [Candida viswanathii]
MTEANASSISTHYYKLAHLGSINYIIYESAVNNDQALLELELTIRHQFPEILITYYNKNLYYFTFGHNAESSIDLVKEFPQLSVKQSDTATTEKFANPLKVPNEYLTYAGLSFLKAIKKMILYNLSLQGSVKLFGNYCVLSNNDQSYSILCIDPVLFQNGDLLLSCLEKPSIRLFNSSLAYPQECAIETNYVIYLVPSGIRCHLFDATSLRNNLVEKPQVENEKLLELLKLTTGVDCNMSNLWVKLIPNLKHLNNQTSFIGKFIHSVDNKKFILWPWELCLLQFGKFENLQQEVISDTPDINNPLNLISDFLDFLISYNTQLQHQKLLEQEQQQQQELLLQSQQQNQLQQMTHAPFSVGSAHSNSGIGSIAEMPKDIGSIGMSATTPMDADLFNLQNTEEFFKTDHDHLQSGDQEGTEQKVEQLDEDDMEIDDLFGGDDSDDESKNENTEIVISSAKVETDDLDDLFADGSHSEEPREEQQSDQPKAEPLPPTPAKEAENDKENLKPKEVKPSYIDILRDQMTIKKMDSSPDYKDPGAPLPIVPTPLVLSTVTQSAGPTNPPTVGPYEASYDSSSNNTSNVYGQSAPPLQMPQQKSVFSPILFNPIIKSDIDTKYGKGGKFYVDKESAKDIDFETKKRTLRATSVSGMELSFSTDDKKKLQQQFDAIESSTTSSVLQEELDEDEDDEDEESDEDEEPDIGDSTPLKLNTYNESMAYLQSNNPATVNNIVTGGQEFQNNGMEKPAFANASLNADGFGSPFASQINKFTMKPESPFSANEIQTSMSPMYFEPSQSQQSPQLQPSVGNTENKSGILDSPSKISESSNYLPLLLRNINIASVPTLFLMNNLTSSKLLPTFSINDDDLENDLDITKSNEMIVKLEYLREFLSFITPNIVFDLGATNFDNFDYYMSNVKDVSDGAKELRLPSETFFKSLSKVFPYMYPVKLIELLHDAKTLELEDPLDNQLNFLNDVENEDESFADPKTLYKKLKSLEWDSFDLSNQNKTKFEKYKDTIEKLNAGNTINDDDYFKLPVVKIRVLKNNNIVNLNNVGLDFWKYLNFAPVKKPKNFQILLIAETQGISSSYASEFLDQLVQNYKESNFGTISKVNLSTVETRTDLDPISDGLVLINKDLNQLYNDFYIQTNKKLISLVELIKLDLINKTNNFEFDRPLLLFFVNFNESLNSSLQICKIFRNFKVALMSHQLPLVEIFTKIAPSSLLVKKVNHESTLRVFNNHRLTKISMNLYNECPNDLANKTIAKNVFTNIVKEPPSMIQFKFINNSYRDNGFNDDIFLHLAYERSIDKNWFVASWSDPLGQVVHTKSWYCSTNSSGSMTGQQRPNYRNDAMDIMAITDDMWNISTELFKFLNDEMNLAGGSTFGGKKFLVLTRVNSIIPDDELIHWKRLSLKHKEISLIVLSVCQTPKVVSSSELKEITSKSGASTSPMSMSHEKDAFFNFKTGFSISSNSSPASGGALVTSPNGLSFHSPQQFLNAPANFLSPQDLTPGGTASGGIEIDPDMVLHHLDDDVHGFVPRLPLPSFNSPTRFCMKTGYLMMNIDDAVEEENGDGSEETKKKSYLLFEINILSCSNYWNLDVLMRLLMLQYKKMIVLNDILCMESIDSEFEDSKNLERSSQIIPWHVNAVGKLLNYLVHIYVDEE